MVSTQLIALAIIILSCDGSSIEWGSYATLSFTPTQPMSYTFSHGKSMLTSTVGSLVNATGTSTTNGTDPSIGAFNVLVVHFADNASVSVRYYQGMDAFVFARSPSVGLVTNVPDIWPSFNRSNLPPNSSRCLGWDEHYFYPGGVGTDINHCSSGGPMFVFETPSQNKQAPPPVSVSAMVLSPLDHFTTNKVVETMGKTGCPTCPLGVDASVGADRCTSFVTSAIVLARPGLQRTIRAFGSFIRQYHNTQRKRGNALKYLSYWNDNQAGYSWWTVGDDQQVWGKPQDIYLKLNEGYTKHNIPVYGWEPDNNWNVTYKQVKNWVGDSWQEFNTTLYPLGGDAFVKQLGDQPMVYYTNGWTDSCVYASDAQYKMVKGGAGLEPHPNTSLQFHLDVFGFAQDHFNMEMLFTDFLCYRGPSMSSYQDVPVGEEGAHMWLAGQTKAAESLGIEVQFCMALASQILASVEWPSVTNARANGDGGLDVPSLVLTSVLASAVGLGWSKDNLRTADKCYVDGLYPNGTVKWPCGSSNQGEGTSGKFTMQKQQTMLATLSLGPVGISDQLSSYPTNASADITSNKTLVMATCTTNGTLLAPSYPVTPVERMMIGGAGFGDCTGANHRAYTYGCGTHLWATYTAVAVDVPNVAQVGLWWTTFAFAVGRGQLNTSIDLLESDLATLIDRDALPSSDFSDIPRGGFHGVGDKFDNTTHVVWFADYVNQRSCADVNVQPWTGAINIPFPQKGDTQTQRMVNVAPVIGNIGLLGEISKVTSVSEHRFAKIASVPGSSSLTVTMRGKPGEVVALLYVVKTLTLANSVGGGYVCKEMTATVTASGFVEATLT